jgi:HB1, ASXL, restriction endonuclease HTH domain
MGEMMMATKTKATAKASNTNVTKKAATPETAKPAAKAKTPPKAPTTGKLSQIAAAERVLAEAGEPMTCKAMVEAMSAKGYWSSPGGKTPEATLYASILRDLKKGKEARFTKVDRGLFSLAIK